ncbi:rab effector Noc2 isoform X5 [Macaca fascicularis]|uniref:rab effector Noc2 isoform X5 n=1 Tax=Macaca fascicularis TaxID=9541 RepID=UPI003D15A974
MADTIFGSGNDQWVCPNDRQLALRAKLQTGWSVHTYQTEKQRRNQHLSPAEVEAILQVIQRAERLDVLEQQRIGRLVERLETMRRNVMGNGLSQCLLCGEVLGFLGSSSVFCKDCRKVWKRSGAWFYKGLPKYILPLKTPGRADDPHVRPVPVEPAEREPRGSETGRIYTWARGRVVSSDSDSDSDLSSSSLEDRLPPAGVRGPKGNKPRRESEADPAAQLPTSALGMEGDVIDEALDISNSLEMPTHASQRPALVSASPCHLVLAADTEQPTACHW